MYVHPIEVAAYYCIFYGSFLIFPVHYSGVILYLLIHGFTGILDHSGIHFEIPYLYNTVDHGKYKIFL